MKARSIYLWGLIAITASLLLCMGCTHVWNISETPALQTGSPLRSVESKTFAFKDFQDIRGVENPSLWGKRGFATYYFDKPPAIVIDNLIRK